MYVMEWKVCKCKNIGYRFLIGFGLFMLVHRVNKYTYLTLKNYFVWHGLADLIALYKPVLSKLESMPFAKSRVRHSHKTCLTSLCADCEEDFLEKFLGIFPKTELSEAERARAKWLCLCLPMAIFFFFHLTSVTCSAFIVSPPNTLSQIKVLNYAL